MRDVWKLRLLLALSVGLGVPAVTSAQFDPGRAGREGPGFKTGCLVLHPGFEVEGGYDSNVFLQDQNEEDAFILKLTGYLDVATEPPIRQREGEGNQPEPQKITFRGGRKTRFQYIHTQLFQLGGQSQFLGCIHTGSRALFAIS